MLYHARSQGIAHGGAHQGKIASGAFSGLEIRASPGELQGWQDHRRQDFIISQDILALDIALGADKKLFERQRAFPAGASQSHACPRARSEVVRGRKRAR